MVGFPEGAIIVCGMQVACKGNQADGTIVFELDGNGPVEIPSCKACADALVDKDNQG